MARCPHDGTPLVGPVETDLVGQILDNRYKVRERIGAGGMGVVYRAEQRLIGRTVALKVLSRELGKDETLVRRFLNEARAIATLRNPHTITLYDFGLTDDGLIYYTMDLLEGRSLLDVIEREAPVEYRRAADLVLQACLSLEEAHAAGILHRDLKPENLYITVDGESEHLTVLDFGIAKLMGSPAGETDPANTSSLAFRLNLDSPGGALTQVGTVCGTPEYMSPEQAAGAELSAASDLYSLSVVLYELLTGQVPFKGDSPMRTMLAHLQEELVPPSERGVHVPAGMERFVFSALEKDPARRLADVAQYRFALLQALAEDGPAMRPSVRKVSGARPKRRDAALLADTVVVARDGELEIGGEPPLEAGHAGGMPAHPSGRDTSAVEASAAPPRGPRRGLLVGATLGGLALSVAIVLSLWPPWSRAPEDPVVRRAEPVVALSNPAVVPLPEPPATEVAGLAELSPALTRPQARLHPEAEARRPARRVEQMAAAQPTASRPVRGAVPASRRPRLGAVASPPEAGPAEDPTALAASELNAGRAAMKKRRYRAALAHLERSKELGHDRDEIDRLVARCRRLLRGKRQPKVDRDFLGIGKLPVQ